MTSSQILNPLERDELVSVLHLNSVPQRQVQLQLQRTTHHGSPLVSDCTGPSDKRPVLAQHAGQEALALDRERFTGTRRSCTEPDRSVGKEP